MKTNENIAYNETLLTAFIAGELDDATAKKVLNWISESKKNQSFYNSIVKTWELTGKITPTPVVVDTNNAWNEVRNSINAEQESVIPINSKSNRRIYLSVAAMIIILVGIFSIIRFTTNSPETINRFASNSVLIDQLSDGTSITLNENSSISYPEAFTENERHVRLTGEAFFEVARDEEKPFIVDLPNETYVKVLGTSFNIKAIDGDSLVVVYVKTGRVEFGTETNNIILTPKQKGIYNKNTNRVELAPDSAIDMTEMYWLDGEINFDGTPLSEVVATLNSVVPDIKIEINCTAAMNLATRETYKKGTPIEETIQSIATLHNLKFDKEEKASYTHYILYCNDL